MGCFRPKYIMFELRKYRKVMFDGIHDWYRVLPKLAWGIWKIFIRALESLKIRTFVTSVCSKLLMYELKIYRGVMCHDNEKWCKIWSGIDLSVQNWHEKFDEFWPEHLKIWKICTLMICFWPKYIIFEIKRYRGVMFDGPEYQCKIWRKTDLCFQKWHEKFSKFSPEHVRKSKTWDFYWVVISKVENAWA